MNRYQTTPTGEPARAGLLRQLKRPLQGLALLAGLVAIGCSQGSYPVDIFYEMHYQQSHKSHEPPRLSAPAGAVAWYPAPQSTSFDTGQHLFAINCSMCHGDGGKGDGPVVRKLTETYGYKPVIDPPDVTDNPVENIVAVLEATTRPFGPDSVMPPFGKLLSDEERLAIAEYIGTASPTPTTPTGEAQPPPPPAPSGGLAISVNGDALEFNKNRLEAAAGSEVVLVFNNVSSINQHNWVVAQAGQKDVVATRGTTAGPDNDWVQPGDPDVIAQSKLLNPGESSEVRFAAPPAGTYQFVCTFPGHNITMFGDFVVTP